MSTKNKRNKQNAAIQRVPRLPWRAVGDMVVDADGMIVKAPHGCSWEGDDYRDDASTAEIIADAVNRVGSDS